MALFYRALARPRHSSGSCRLGIPMPVSSNIAEGWRRFVDSDWWRRLDAAQWGTYASAMQSLRDGGIYDPCRAGPAFADLKDGLAGLDALLDYADPYMAVAYLIDYHLKHCAMATVVWWDFFERHGAPHGLSVLDFGAGSGAGAVGLNIAQDLRRRARLPTVDYRRIWFGSYEPSEPMRRIGDRFAECLRMSIKPGYQGIPELVNGGADDVLRVVTAFHPALPYGNGGGPLGVIADDFGIVVAAVAPDVVLGTAHTGKERSLCNLLGTAGASKLTDLGSDELSDFPRRPSRFYTQRIPIADGFEDPKSDVGNRQSLRYRSYHRFSLPNGVLVEKVAARYVSPRRLGATRWTRAHGLDVVGLYADERRQQREEEHRHQKAEETFRLEAEKLLRERLELEGRERAHEEAREREQDKLRKREEAKWDALHDARSSGGAVRVSLLYRNEGGWVVEYDDLRGFMPRSQSGEYREREGERSDGVEVAVLRVEHPGNAWDSGNFVVSRRKIVSSRHSQRLRVHMRQRRAEAKRAAWQGFSAVASDVFEGKVSGIAEFGVFVRLEGGVEGLVHISTLGGANALAQYTAGQRVTVSVLSVDSEQMRLSLRIGGK